MQKTDSGQSASTSSISLPSGGGAVKGMGESFAPDLFTGTGNFSVPIALPAGRNGFQPQLTIVYSSGNGNGAFGLGWNLSVPGVTRKTSRGIPLYDEDKDVFLLSGAEDLVEVSRNSTTGVRLYRPRTEGLFARIERHLDINNDYWKVWSKDGLISYYGTENSINTKDTYNDQATVANPNYKSNIFEWKLSKTEDVFGNRIEYIYQRTGRATGASPSDPHDWDMLYLSEIRYADYIESDVPKFLCSVKFVYQERPDFFSTYRSGFEMRHTLRCDRIELYTHPDDSNLLTKAYDFIYVDERVKAGELDKKLLPHNGSSLLSQVKIIGYDGEATEAMPPLEFTYTTFNPIRRDFDPVRGKELPSLSLGEGAYDLIDLNGNGLPDIVEMGGALPRYWRNLGNGTFDIPRTMKDAPSGIRLDDPEVSLADANGDGRPDLMVNKQGLNGYFSLGFNGEWDKKSFKRQKLAPSFSLFDPEVRMLDLDGDGITDVLRNGSRFECFFNDAEEGFYKTTTVDKKTVDKFPNISFADPRLRFADMTGDGMQDMVLIHNGTIEYWPNLGHGRWGSRVVMKNSPRFPYQFNNERIIIGDIDGDGCNDLLFVEDNQVRLWINKNGEGWSEEIIITGTPSARDMKGVRLADLCGWGTASLVWSYNYDGTNKERMFWLDFNGAVKPYVLNEMNNHMGAITRVEYRASTYYYLSDRDGYDPLDENNPILPTNRMRRSAGKEIVNEGTPRRVAKKKWKTHLPFPVQVVAKTEVFDELSKGKLVTRYAYHHGYWDGGEREFRGFGNVEQFDTETFERFNEGKTVDFNKVKKIQYAPPMHTKNWFHLGPVGDQYGDWQEVDFSDEYWSEDPNVLQRPESMKTLLKSLPRRARRDAYRTLRGSSLRSEVYALDGTARQNRPYTVTENLQGVRLEFAPPTFQEGLLAENPSVARLSGSGNKQGSGYIFFSFGLASRSSQWERGSEPMTSFSFSEDYDAYGMPRKQIAVAVPRGKNPLANTFSGGAYLATYAETSFVHRDDENKYLIGRAITSAAFEFINDGSVSVFKLKQEILDITTTQDFPYEPLTTNNLQLTTHQLTFYDGTAFTGLSHGLIGNYGVAVRSETLVFTDAQKEAIYGAGQPLYIKTSGSPSWTSEYPTDFRSTLPANAGYTYYLGNDNIHLEGYYCVGNRTKFDFHDSPSTAKGLPLQSKDPLDNVTTITYDSYSLFPATITDALGMETSAAYDYRVMQASEIKDPNENRSQVGFSPLGFVIKTAQLGKSTESVGDTLDHPGTEMEYDFFAFYNSKQPVFVKSTVHEGHYNPGSTSGNYSNTIVSVQYSDGFGRLIQSRAQAEEVVFGNSLYGDAGLAETTATSDASAVGVLNSDTGNINVIVSGWQVYDNKGRVVEKYEPYYDKGFDFDDPLTAGTSKDVLNTSQKVQLFYDPRGQVIRTINPDKTEQRVLFGIPLALGNPNVFTPTPWESYTYDANDLAEITHNGDTTVPTAHHYTPSNSVIDALGRTIKTIDRNYKDSAIEEIVMKYTFDIRGNLLTVKDPYERTVFAHTYDLLNRPLKTTHIDAGTKIMVMDCMSKPIEARDEKGSLVLNTYDELNRPTHVWCRDKSGEATTLRHKTLYGDNAGLSDPKYENLKGKPYKQYDEAGLTTFVSYDFKGNLRRKIRRVIDDEEILAVFDGPPTDWAVDTYRVDWEESDDSILSNQEFDTFMIYDALNRITHLYYPEDVEEERRILRLFYNKSGALESVVMDGDTYVERIAYNARGQRILLAMGNGVMTRYRYRSDNFRLLRMKSEKYTKTGLTYALDSGTVRQNYSYTYDLAGNIINIKNEVTGCGVAGTNELQRNFSYDALYRLLSATGRETAATASYAWDDTYRPENNGASRAYTQNYDYDKLGNIQELQHLATSANFTRTFDYVTDCNKLDTITIGADTYNFSHDVNGNMLSEGDTARHLQYDYADRLKSFAVQTGTAEPSKHAQYLYDAGGNRVKKMMRTQGGAYQVTVYIDGIFEYTKESNYSAGIPNLTVGSWTVGGNTGEQNTLHIMDGNSRIAIRRLGDALGDPKPAVKYNLEDHLGSSTLQLGTDGAVISSEEYYPFGETSFGSYGKKRYRFCGKERDEESGLYFYGMRYYSAWTCRFISVDPLADKYAHLTPYAYADNKPINHTDIDGAETGSTQPSEQSNGGQNGPRVQQTNSTTQNNNTTGTTAESVRQQGNASFYKGVQEFNKSNPPVQGGSGIKPKENNIKGDNTTVETKPYIPLETIKEKAINAETGTLTTHTPNLAEKIDKKIEENPLATLVSAPLTLYKMADDAHVYATHVTGEASHISGELATPNEVRDAGVSTLVTIGTAGMASAESSAAKSAGNVTQKLAESRSLYHYTTEAGYDAIMQSKALNPSVGVKNARFGSGQYLTDIAPGSFTKGQTSYRLYGVPWNSTRLTHYVKIETSGLNIIKNKPFNFLNPSSTPLNLNGRIMGGGKSTFK